MDFEINLDEIDDLESFGPLPVGWHLRPGLWRLAQRDAVGE